jgi:flavin reductase (DIM6/NTAB) family NADH-FMN oxidoreductase RutF
MSINSLLLKKIPFQEVDPLSIPDNVFRLIGDDWMLITAGTLARFNTMTASWGGLGVLWNRKVCFCVIRPQRYTRRFMDEASTFSLTFFEEKYRPALEFCGTHSGREVDKAKACNLNPMELALGLVGFGEARLILGCRKIYFQDLDPEHFLEPAIETLYPSRDYHRLYIGELTHCWQPGHST